jgi:hypothetical protein
MKHLNSNLMHVQNSRQSDRQGGRHCVRRSTDRCTEFAKMVRNIRGTIHQGNVQFYDIRHIISNILQYQQFSELLKTPSLMFLYLCVYRLVVCSSTCRRIFYLSPHCAHPLFCLLYFMFQTSGCKQ